MKLGPRGWRRIEKLANPPMRWLVLAGLAPRAFALLETTGHRTGRRRRTPVGNGLDGDAFWLVAGRGRRCGYVANLKHDPACRIRVRRSWRSGVAHFVEEPEPMARRQRIEEANGVIGRIDGVFFRAAAGDPLTVRIDLD